MKNEEKTVDEKHLLDVAGRVVRAWTAACEAEPIMFELLLPGELRYALAELTRTVGR